MLETDAPFPRTEEWLAGETPPRVLCTIAREVARLQGRDVRSVVAQCDHNAQRLFGNAWAEPDRGTVDDDRG